MIRTAVITVSDTRTGDTDVTGKALVAMLEQAGFAVNERLVVKDDEDAIAALLDSLTDDGDTDLVLTAGGTGLGPRDVTPEATRQVIEKELPALSAYIAAEGTKKNKRALLSRAVAGICGRSLVINLPGSPIGATESLGFVLDVLPHAVSMIRGEGH